MAIKLRRFFKHPFVVIIPLVGALAFGWQYHLAADQHFNVSRNNILPGGSFDTFDSHNVPNGWLIKASGELQHSLGQEKGYVKGNMFTLSVDEYRTGNVTLESDKVNVQPNKAYLFKGYYWATTSIDLLVRYYYKDGTSRLELAHEYVFYNDPWSTASMAFTTGDSIVAVRFMYRMASEGTLRVDETYLEQKDTGIHLNNPPALANNLIPNPSLSAPHESQLQQPQHWFPYTDGSNKASFEYAKEGDNAFVRADITDYKNGEAKWQYDPLPAEPGQYYAFNTDYRSDLPADVVVEYELANGGREFDSLDTLMPASEWVRFKRQFDVPEGAKNVMVSVILHGNGHLDTDNYGLYNLTKPGPERRFKHPLVSFTFDDAWYSDYDPGAKMIDEYGYKGTFYVNPSAIDTVPFMRASHLNDLKQRGHHLASHGNDHVDMTGIDTKYLDDQFRRAYEYMQQGLGVKDIDFATPYGKNDAEVQWYLRKYYRSHRGTETGINTKQNFDRYDLKVLFIGNNTTLERVQEDINDAKAYSGWLILVYHRIEDNVKTSTSITPSTFKKHLELVKKSGVQVKTVDAALAELGVSP